MPPGKAQRLFLNGKAIAQCINLSTFAEQMLVHENAVVKIDPDIPLDGDSRLKPFGDRFRCDCEHDHQQHRDDHDRQPERRADNGRVTDRHELYGNVRHDSTTPLRPASAPPSPAPDGRPWRR